MKQQITVDGVVLTREQVERALEELNRPELPVIEGGELIRECGSGLTWIAVAPYCTPFERRAEGYVLGVSPRDGSTVNLNLQNVEVLISGYEKKVVEGFGL